MGSQYVVALLMTHWSGLTVVLRANVSLKRIKVVNRLIKWENVGVNLG